MTTVEHLLDLLMRSPLHRRWTLEHIVRVFVPPLTLGQYYVQARNGRMTAFASWAFMSDEHSQRYIETHRMMPEFWNSGPHLWLAEIIAPNGGLRQMRHDLERYFTERGHTYARGLRPRDKTRQIHYVVNTRALQEIAA